MAYRLNDKLVIGISSRALFDLEEENNIFEQKGVGAYRDYQLKNEDKSLKTGTGMPFIKALLELNSHFEEPIVEVVIMSRNTADTGLRVFNSIEHYGLAITRAAFSGGKGISSYLNAFNVDLFLSKNEEDVQHAINTGFAASILYEIPENFKSGENEIRIAFDGDAVLFSDESECVFKEKGLKAFVAHELANKDKNLPEGPFAKLLITISDIQKKFPNDSCPVRTAVVTARATPAHTRVIKTLRNWGVTVDEVFFLGGVEKAAILEAFGAHIFFDDQDTHIVPASKKVPSGKVPYITDTKRK